MLVSFCTWFRQSRYLPLCILVCCCVSSFYMLVKFHHEGSGRHLDVGDSQQDSGLWSPLLEVGGIIQNCTSTTVDANWDHCFPYNSRKWFLSKRFGNQNTSYLTDDYMVASILHLDNLVYNLDRIMEHTICHRASALLLSSEWIKDASISHIAFRLLYMAIHIHQHRHAELEAKQLSTMSFVQAMRQTHGVGSFDFECQHANFLVVPMKQRGLGAVLRNDVATAFMAGIATNRIVLFINGANAGPNYLQAPWEWSSCPRRDKQCFFLPDSPCVLTYNDLENATMLNKGERRRLFKTGQVPEMAENARVIIMDTYTRPQRTPPNFRERVTKIIQQYIIQPMRYGNPVDPRLLTLSKAIEFILSDDETLHNSSSSFGYFGRNSTAHHAMVLYAMRPNHHYPMRLESMMVQTFATVQQQKQTMLGLPIRATDKCLVESECPPFDLYMELMESLWKTHYFSHIGENSNQIRIVLTTESPDVLKAKQDYVTTNMNLSFPILIQQRVESAHYVPFDFVTNSLDTVQGTGDPTKLKNHANITKEEILLSTLASLKLQLYTHHSIANCCSNHHLLLVDMLQEGCGAHYHNHDMVPCMQDHPDPKFHLCCAWTTSPECLEKQKVKARKR